VRAPPPPPPPPAAAAAPPRPRRGFLAVRPMQRLAAVSSHVSASHNRLPGIALLEHVNLYVGDEVGDRSAAEYWYFDVLGLIPDVRLPGQFAALVSGASSSADDAVAGSEAGVQNAFAIGTNDLIHANCGLSQMHLPVQGRRDQYGTQTIRGGSVTLAYTQQGLDQVQTRVRGAAEGKFNGRVTLRRSDLDGEVEAIDPWGQVFRLVLDDDDTHRRAAGELGTHPPSPHSPNLHPTLQPAGIPAVDVRCNPGTADRIAIFYGTLFNATTSVEAGVATIFCGPDSTPHFQRLRFVESVMIQDRRSTAAWTENSFADQWHLAMYIEDFTGTYERFQAHPHVSHWDNPRIKDYADTLEKALARQQFRFNSIVDLKSGEVLLELEHEIRSIEHQGCPLGRTADQARSSAMFLGTDTPVF
jgi:hypothetical protein